MPVPKRKVSKSRRDKRSANKHIRPKILTGCAHCQHPLLPHQACNNCGFYKGKKVLNTKYERTLKRTQARKAAMEKKAQAAESAPESSEGSTQE